MPTARRAAPRARSWHGARGAPSAGLRLAVRARRDALRPVTMPGVQLLARLRGGASAACARSQSAEASRARLACARRDVSRRGFDAAWQHQRTRRVCSIRRCARARRTPSAPTPARRRASPPRGSTTARTRRGLGRGGAAAARRRGHPPRPLRHRAGRVLTAHRVQRTRVCRGGALRRLQRLLLAVTDGRGQQLDG